MLFTLAITGIFAIFGPFTAAIFWNRLSSSALLLNALSTSCFSLHFWLKSAETLYPLGGALPNSYSTEIFGWTGAFVHLLSLPKSKTKESVNLDRLLALLFGIMAVINYFFGHLKSLLSFGFLSLAIVLIFDRLELIEKIKFKSFRALLKLENILIFLLPIPFLAGDRDLGFDFGFGTLYFQGIVSLLCISGSVYRMNQTVNETYRRRDYLLTHLQAEVDAKTLQLRDYTHHLSETLDRLKTAHSEIEESILRRKYRTQMISRIALETAHDIRSPSAALSVLSSSLNDSLIETQILKRSILNIRFVADTLLERFQKLIPELSSSETADHSSELSQSVLAVHLLEKILVEKQYRHKNNSAVQLHIASAEETLFDFVTLPPNSFKRVISNLLDNAVESIQSDGKVVVEINKSGTSLQIHIIDNGIGIPKSQMEHIGKIGHTFGKAQGSGIGLSQAIASIHRWGGELKIESKEGEGTTVSLLLPIATRPEWFLTEIKCFSGIHLCVIDDDPSILASWRAKLNHSAVATLEYKLSFLPSLDLLADLQMLEDKSEHPDLYLMDYQFGSDVEKNPLELICRLNIQAQTILVSDHFDNPSIQDFCLKKNIRIVPKYLIADIAISMEAKLKAGADC